MNSRIGAAFRIDARRATLACLVAVLALALDFGFGSKFPFSPVRLIYSALFIGLLLGLGRNDRASLGLRLAPKQGFKYWARAAAFIGLTLGTTMLLIYGAFLLLGLPTHEAGPPAASGAFVLWMLRALLVAPILEEPLYRVVLVSGLRAVFPSWAVILIDGLAFAALHFLYGSADITNALAGFVLSWAFLKSESISIPVSLHFFGNLCVVLINVVGWSLH